MPSPHSVMSMPWPGAPSIAAKAGERIEDLAFELTDLVETSTIHASRLAPADLTPLSIADTYTAVGQLRHAFAWVDDWFCDHRAVLGTQLLRETTGGVGGVDDAVRGAVAFVRRADDHPGQWLFHAAPAFRDAATGEVKVIDFLLDPEHGIVDLAQFARSVGRSAEDVQLMHPLVRPGNGMPLARDQVEFMADELRHSVGIERERIAAAAGLPNSPRDVALA